jgi:hypothetical protein
VYTHTFFRTIFVSALPRRIVNRRAVYVCDCESVVFGLGDGALSRP